MTDPVDEALKALARAEASPDFSAQVRARVAADVGGHRAWWPRVVTACAALAMVATLGWLMRSTTRDGSEQVSTSAAREITVRPPTAAPQLEPRARRQDVSASTPVVKVARPVAQVRTARSTADDHDRALAPLSPLDELSMRPIDPDAMVLGDQVVNPLAPIAPIPVVGETVGDDK